MLWGGNFRTCPIQAYAANLSNYYPVLGKASFGDILRAFVWIPSAVIRNQSFPI